MKHKYIAGLAGLAAVLMLGASFAAVPLYRIFCQVTGFGGTPQRSAGLEQVLSAEEAEKTWPPVTIRFDANTDPGLPWLFRPEKTRLRVRPGEPVLAFYETRNLSAQDLSGVAVFNVTPFKAGPYFVKIECFCFEEKILKAGESVRLPVQFYVDPELFQDSETRGIRTITLSYRFYREAEDAERFLETAQQAQQ